MLRVVDVSSHQAGIDIASLDCDAVIVKATGGTDYMNEHWKRFADAAISSGKLLGLYHYAMEYGRYGSAREEAEHFLSVVGDYASKAVIALDFEADAQGLPVSWAREWLDIVAGETGATPMFYAYAAYLNSRDHSEIADYPLWMASYLDRYGFSGWVADPVNVWATSSWQGMVCYQYTSTGNIGGWGGNLDLSVFYGTESDWRRLEGGMTDGEELIALVRSKAGQWRYTNDYPDRLDPDAYGGTDCSGVVRWAYGKFGYNVGTWTGDESHAGYEIARGHYPRDIPWDIMRPGDLILMTATYWNNYDFDQYLCHIELYCGDGKMIGHPGGWGPQEKWAQSWMESYGCITWMVRRVFDGDDDMRPNDVWEYNYENTAPGGNMYNALVSTTNAVCTPHESAAGDGTVGSMKDRLDYVDMRVGKMYDMLMEGGLTVQAQAIDYDALADAVANKLAKRMAE